MEFREYLAGSEKDLQESAQLKLELMSKINSLISTAELTMLRKVVKILESGTTE